ncbi:MAG TPA: tyrosine-type recombinase/integrase [Gemmataceae bacterium]|jgi:integrase|nr:tyrosine-type recombinase/integrase [Gemmataceae bacterium]
MSATHPTAPASPSKPYPDFPLFPHASGQWAKKIRGRMHYFGLWADPDAALARYLEQKDALHAGRKPRPEPGAVTVKDAANDFLNAKQALVDAGELSPRTWADYKEVCDLMVVQVGKARLVDDLGPDDFASLRNKVAKRWGPARLGNRLIQYTRSLFKHAFDAGMIDRPVRFGPGFKRPSAKVMRLNRAAAGPKLFTAGEVRRLINAAGVQLRAMILLGINCGFGNADCATLPLSALDLDGGWVNYPRPKTGIGRRCPLWPETVAALREALAKRPEPKAEGDAGLVFVTKYGAGWHKASGDNPVSFEAAKLLKALGINGRKGLGFYTLRHTFRTVADGAKDQPAADHIMGHEVAHMSSVYRETISNERLRVVADHVRAWLYAEKGSER